MCYDNCKTCYSACEHAGKDREFVCPGGVSCKTEAPATAEKIRIHIGRYQTEDINGEATILIDDPVSPNFSHEEVIMKLMEELDFHPSPELWCSDCDHDDCATCPGSADFDYSSVTLHSEASGGVDRENASFYYSFKDLEIPASIIARIRKK